MINVLWFFRRLCVTAFCFACVNSTWAALPFNDSANRPSNIGPGVIIETENNGFWRVIDGSYYAGTQRTENVFAYSDNGGVRLSFLTSGVSFPVNNITPIKTDTISRPANMNPGTALQASSGDVWKIIEGSYYGGSTASERAIIYSYAGRTWISLSKSGVAVQAELISGSPLPEPNPTLPSNCSSSRYDPFASKVVIPCLEIPVLNTKMVFDTEWDLVTDETGVITLKLRRAEQK